MAKRLLIAAGGSAEGIEQLPFGVRELIDAAEEILVVAPALPSRLEWLASATDRAREQADERLRTVLGQLTELGRDPLGQLALTTRCSPSTTRSGPSRRPTSSSDSVGRWRRAGRSAGCSIGSKSGLASR